MTIKTNKRATCHPDKQHHSRGLCGACYMQWKRDNDPTYKQLTLNYGRQFGRRNALKTRYGITTADYDRMFEEQGGVCKLCNRNPHKKTRLSVDHSHSTGFVRGLLCIPCNRSLGLLEDPIWRQKADAYLFITNAPTSQIEAV
jgi:hypothetical protein